MKEIVIIHGWGASVLKFEPLQRELERLDWKVHLIKLPGFDLKDPQWGWGIEEYAKYVENELSKSNNNKNPIILFGHSFGGMISSQIVANNKIDVSGLVLCATNGVVRTSSVKRILFQFLAKVGKFFTKLLGIEDISRKLLYRIARVHDYEKTSGTMREVFQKAINFDIKPLVENLKTPILVLWGSEDKMTPVNAVKELHSLNTKVSSHIFNGIRHNLPYIQPEQVANQIDKWYEDMQKKFLEQINAGKTSGSLL